MASVSDADFVEIVLDALDKRVDEQRFGRICEPGGMRNFSPAEKVVLLTWWAVPIIENGGFQYFYEGATNAVEVADAFDSLGLTEAATACRKSLEVFPNNVPPTEQDDRIAILEPFYGIPNMFFKPLNESLWDAGKVLDQAIAAYVRAHRSEFYDAMPD